MLAALSHGLDVIEFLAGEQKPSLLGAVASAIGMSKAGTHRILTTLAARGFVVRGEGGVYSLGYKAWEIGWSVPGVQMVPRAVPVMQRLAADIGDGAILGALDSGFEVVYLHVIESQQAVRVYIDVGSRLPANVTATGLACLAWLPRERLDAILPKKLSQWAPETIVDSDLDALWFSRRSKPDSEAWELRRLSALPYALVAVVSIPIDDDELESTLDQVVAEMREKQSLDNLRM